MYRELDKVILNIMKQFTSEDSKKSFKLLQAQVKRLFDFYTTSAQLLQETTEEAAFIRRSNGGFSCASCDKDVTNLFNSLNQSNPHANKNKQKDYSIKGPGFSRILKAQHDNPGLKASNSQIRVGSLEVQDAGSNSHFRISSLSGKLEEGDSGRLEPQTLPEITPDKKK